MNENAADDPIKRLAEYWFRAKLMHELLHTLLEMYDDENTNDARALKRIYKEGHWWEFETYLDYWLSALFVVVEGFNKLGLKNKRVQDLFNSHIGELKQVRHNTYHFSVNKAPFLREINWAEELHEAIGEVIREYINEKAKTERAVKARKRVRTKTPI